MNNKIRIVSDGTPANTKVFACALGPDGKRLGADVELTQGIERIEMFPITADSSVRVQITFCNCELDALADLVEK